MIRKLFRTIGRVIPYVGMTLSILALLLYVPRVPRTPVVSAIPVAGDVCIVASSFYAGVGEFGAIVEGLDDNAVVFSRHDPIQNIKLAEELLGGHRCRIVILRGEVATALLAAEHNTASVVALSPWFISRGELRGSATPAGVAVYGSKDLGVVKWVSKEVFPRWHEVPGTYSTVPYSPRTLEVIWGVSPVDYVPAYITFGINTVALAILLISLSYLIPLGGDDGVRISWSWIFLVVYPLVGLVAVLGYRVGWEPYGVYGGWFWLLVGAALSLLALVHVRFDIREMGVGVALSLLIAPLALGVLRWCGIFPYLDRAKLVYGVLLGLIYIPWFVYVAAAVRWLMRYPLSALAVWPVGTVAWLPVVSTAFVSGMLPLWHVFFFGWQMTAGVLLAGLLALPVIRRHAVWGGVLASLLYGVLVAGVLPPV